MFRHAPPSRRSIPSDRNHLRDISRRIEHLEPGQHFTIPNDVVDAINLPSLRSKICQLNRKRGINLKLHRETSTGMLWVWYAPSAPPPSLSNLETFTGTVRQLQALANLPPDDPALKEILMQLQTPVASLPHRSAGSIHCTLEETLEVLNIDQPTWETIPPLRQMQLRIETGILLRNRRLQARRLSHSRKFYKEFAERFGVALAA